MNYVICLFFMFMSSSCFGSERVPEKTIAEIKSQDVSFDGKRVLLSGKVIITHTLGILSCDKAILVLSSKVDTPKNGSPEKIILQKNVKVDLKDGSVLTADDADIDCVDLEGVFTAIDPNKVIYLTYMQEGERRVPIRTKSSAMHLKMKKEEKEGSSQYVLSDIRGEGAVTIEYEVEGK